MTTTSRIPSVVDALVTAFGTISGVTILDGPAAEGHAGTWLAVGSTTDSDDIDFDQEWAGIGGFQRNEDFTVPCQIRFQSGNKNGGFKTVRDGAFAVFASVENLLRADPTVGVSGYTVRAQIGSRGRANQTFQSGGGAFVCVLDFTITVQTRI